MSLKEKIEMTEEEKVTWRNKLDALKVFSATFSKYRRVVSFDTTFYSSLSIKELLSEEFEEEASTYILKLEPRRDVPFATVISNKIKEEATTADLFKSFDENEWHEFYDRVIRAPYVYTSSGDYIYGLERVRRNDFFNYSADLRKDYENYVYCIGNYGDFVEKEFIPDSTLDKVITKAFLSKDTKDLSKLATFISKKFKNFHNYSPILFNESLDAESRGKLLKSFYRQKDLPKYKEFLRRNRHRLDIFDTFIDVTITNNNRVTEKDANFINLLISIYVTPDAYRLSSLNADSCVGLEKFANKYRNYFLNPAFISKIYSYGVGSMEKEVYNRKREFNNFMSTIFSAYTVDEILDSLFNIDVSTISAENFAGATEPIAESLKCKFTADDIELNKKLVRFFLARNNHALVRDNIQARGELSEYASTIAPYADSYFRASSKRIGNSKLEVSRDLALDLFANKDIIKALHSLHFSTEKATGLLGFVKDDVIKSKNNNDYLQRLYNVHDALLAVYEKVATSGNLTKDVARSFYDVYLSNYTTDKPFEYSISEIPLLAADADTQSLQRYRWYNSGNSSKSTSEAYVDIIKRISALAPDMLLLLDDEITEELQTSIKETLSNIETNVSLLCAI